MTPTAVSLYRPDDTGGAAHSCSAGHTTYDNFQPSSHDDHYLIAKLKSCDSFFRPKIIRFGFIQNVGCPITVDTRKIFVPIIQRPRPASPTTNSACVLIDCKPIRKECLPKSSLMSCSLYSVVYIITDQDKQAKLILLP